MQFNLLPWRESHMVNSAKKSYKIALICFLTSSLLCLSWQTLLRTYFPAKNHTLNLKLTNKQQTNNYRRKLFYNGLRIITNTPTNVYLSSAQLQNNTLKIKGTTTSTKTLHAFINDITHLKLLKKTKASMTPNKNLINFIITGILNKMKKRNCSPSKTSSQRTLGSRGK